jgi:hypothetical protein
LPPQLAHDVGTLGFEPGHDRREEGKGGALDRGLNEMASMAGDIGRDEQTSAPDLRAALRAKLVYMRAELVEMLVRKGVDGSMVALLGKGLAPARDRAPLYLRRNSPSPSFHS